MLSNKSETIKGIKRFHTSVVLVVEQDIVVHLCTIVVVLVCGLCLYPTHPEPIHRPKKIMFQKENLFKVPLNEATF